RDWSSEVCTSDLIAGKRKKSEWHSGGNQMDTKFKKIVLDHSDTIVDMRMDEIVTLKLENNASDISHELFERTNREFVNVIFTSIINKDSTKTVEAYYEKLINLGWQLSYITDGLQIFRRVTIDYILSQSHQVDSVFFSDVLKSVDHWVEPIIRQLVNDYSGSWEHIVSL